MKENYGDLGIVLHNISIAMPQANGQVEAVSKQAINALRKKIEDAKELGQMNYLGSYDL